MIKYRKGYKYQLTENYDVELGIAIVNDVIHPLFTITTTGRISVKCFYAWNGPSWPAIDTKNFMRGSLIHDMLYQSICEGLLPKSFRESADKILKSICIEDGMSRIRATWVYYGVRIGGGPAIRHDRKEYSAP